MHTMNDRVRVYHELDYKSPGVGSASAIFADHVHEREPADDLILAMPEVAEQVE